VVPIVRPVLRPGTHVLRRGRGELQLGLDPRRAVVLPDSPAVRRTLTLLAGSAPRADHDPALLALLHDHDLVVDERDLHRLSAEHAVRDRWRIVVRRHGHPCGEDLRLGFVRLAAASGIREAPPRQSGAPSGAVLVGVGEPERELLDGWTRAGTPYLLVRLTERRAVLGPFVVPGRTACLRCIDAHRTDADRAWPLLVRQYAAAASRDRADGAVEPVDPALAAMALAWAARDLSSYVEGRRPSTWSATITVEPDLSELESRTWLRHPACGCSWQ
jgi:bacteriocin biosynthesis cyclodehydratase domain-containing protein